MSHELAHVFETMSFYNENIRNFYSINDRQYNKNRKKHNSIWRTIYKDLKFISYNDVGPDILKQSDNLMSLFFRKEK